MCLLTVGVNTARNARIHLEANRLTQSQTTTNFSCQDIIWCLWSTTTGALLACWESWKSTKRTSTKTNSAKVSAFLLVPLFTLKHFSAKYHGFSFTANLQNIIYIYIKYCTVFQQAPFINSLVFIASVYKYQKYYYIRNTGFLMYLLLVLHLLSLYCTHPHAAV